MKAIVYHTCSFFMAVHDNLHLSSGLDMLLENRQEVPRQEKPSLKRELKKKHQQQFILPLQKGLCRHQGVSHVL